MVYRPLAIHNAGFWLAHDVLAGPTDCVCGVPGSQSILGALWFRCTRRHAHTRPVQDQAGGPGKVPLEHLLQRFQDTRQLQPS